MREFRTLSIDRKLMLIIMGTSSAALLLASVAFATYEIMVAHTLIPLTLQALAEMIGVNSRVALSFDDPKLAAETLVSLQTQPQILRACTYLPDGKPLAQYRRFDLIEDFVPPTMEAEGSRFMKDRLALFHRIIFDGEWIGTVYLESDLRSMYTRIKRNLAIGVTVLAACSLVAFLLSTQLRRVISVPILQLARAARMVATEKNYSVRVAKRNEDELGQLIDGFNEMLRQIQTRDAALEEARDDLERRVEARTVELSQANEQLKQEIRDREQAEAAQQKQVALIQNSRDFIGIATLAGKVEFLNAAGRKLVGFQPEENVLDTSIEQYVPEECQEQLRETILRAVRDFGSWEGETKLRHWRTGQTIPVYMSAFSVRDAQTGQPICLATVTRDMTDYLNLEAQLRQSQKMEAIGQLAAGVAHDFNNIMTIIQGYTSLVLSTARLNSEAAESLQQVSTAADRAANLTRQLLTFSRKQVMQLRSLDLNSVVNRVTSMLGRLLGEHIHVECQLGPSLPAIQADVGMIEQLITNLAVNARDAMPRGGRLSISTQAREIDPEYLKHNSEARLGLFVCLTVADSGCGMESATLSKLFEPFFTTKEVGKGTGLGLATVYGVVKQHQGWIEVASEVGKGSVFRVYFPAHMEAVPEDLTQTPLPPAFSRGHETILVVEDEPALRRLALQVLRQCGYKVFEARTGQEALKLWRNHAEEIDLLLTDMVMPEGINGRELAERLRNEKRRLRVVYTSGYSMDAPGQDFLLREGVAVLPKPYQPATLARVVRGCLDGVARSS